MNMGMGGNPMSFDASNAYRVEREALGIAKHTWIADEAEKRLLGDAYPTDAMNSLYGGTSSIDGNKLAR